MTGGRREPLPIELVRPSFYGMLVFYYCGVTTFGGTSAVFVSPSLALAGGGDAFAFWWAVSVIACSALAVLGLVLSRRLEFGWIEFGATVVLIAALTGFTAALFLRGFTVPGAAASIPIAVIVLVLCVLPVWRLMVMAQDKTVIFKRLGRRQLHPAPLRTAESRYR